MAKATMVKVRVFGGPLDGDTVELPERWNRLITILTDNLGDRHHYMVDSNEGDEERLRYVRTL